jgi:serine phosphatase RsbU (regulator of sigma subunit)
MMMCQTAVRTALHEDGRIDGLLDVRSFKLERGDAMLLYTDGITEARSGHSMLDNSGLKEQFERLGARSAREIMDGLMGHLLGFEVTDDVAAIVLKQH